MERELDCEVVKDLLPLYVDGMVSDVSKRSIEHHLGNCKYCDGIYHNMAAQLEIDTQPADVQDVKRFLKRTKKMYLLYGLGILSFLAILVCVIVDLAVNRGITWSLIVGCACLFADIFIYSLTVSRKNRGCIVMAVASIGTLCLLFAIQITTYYLMGTGTFWIFRYGLPILAVWLLVLWPPVLTGSFLKWNLWDSAALLMLLAIIGNYATKLITGDYAWNDIRIMRGFWGNAFGEGLLMILFFMIGRIRKWKK